MITKNLIKDVSVLFKVPEIKITCITEHTIIGSVLFQHVSMLCRICLIELNDSYVVEFNGLDGSKRLFFKISDTLPF